MGPYCKFCDHRCFVERIANDRLVLLATCTRGMEHDRQVTGGLDHTTAANPYDTPTSASRPL